MLKKKIISALLSVIIVLTFTSCAENTNQKNKITIICTLSPFYDWTENIVGSNSNVNVELLVNNGVDIHNFQPTVNDIIEIKNCNILIYSGGESEDWIKELVNENQIIINLIDVLGKNSINENTINSIESENSADDNSFDEHVWLSLKNAELFCREIYTALSNYDNANANQYFDNYQKYSLEIYRLENEYTELINNSFRNTVIVADRFPFVYLFNDYNIKYCAAFSGCSSEAGATFDIITEIKDVVEKNNSKYIITTENPVKNFAETVKDNSVNHKLEILQLNSMQGTISDTYLDVMRNNLDVLVQALN